MSARETERRLRKLRNAKFAQDSLAGEAAAIAAISLSPEACAKKLRSFLLRGGAFADGAATQICRHDLFGNEVIRAQAAVGVLNYLQRRPRSEIHSFRIPALRAINGLADTIGQSPEVLAELKKALSSLAAVARSGSKIELHLNYAHPVDERVLAASAMAAIGGNEASGHLIALARDAHAPNSPSAWFQEPLSRFIDKHGPRHSPEPFAKELKTAGWKALHTPFLINALAATRNYQALTPLVAGVDHSQHGEAVRKLVAEMVERVYLSPTAYRVPTKKSPAEAISPVTSMLGRWETEGSAELKDFAANLRKKRKEWQAGRR